VGFEFFCVKKSVMMISVMMISVMLDACRALISVMLDACRAFCLFSHVMSSLTLCVRECVRAFVRALMEEGASEKGEAEGVIARRV